MSWNSANANWNLSPLLSSLSILTAAPTTNRVVADVKPSGKSLNTKARGQAMLTFANANTLCVISGITLQTLTGAIKREELVPSIFETVVISIVQNNGEDVARLNGYVHSLQAGENNINAGVLKLVIRFVDDDPQKLEQLSRYIATL